MSATESVFKQWIGQQLGSDNFTLCPLKGDASFRAYYRVTLDEKSYIVMWAPPEKEQTRPFVEIARAWHHHGLRVPTVHGWEVSQGFVLLSDFGDTLLYDVLTPTSVDDYYQKAMQILPSLQRMQVAPLFNEDYIRLELSYFKEWFLHRYLSINTDEISTILESTFSQLVASNLAQPQVVIHRDYHSRNLMVLNEGNLGIIDFQDAMMGPITYDLVSLLKDCYIDWPTEKVAQWVKSFYDMTPQAQQVNISEFTQWFDWTGLQRHLKVLGIFARLYLRDNKPNYLNYMPRIMNYVLQVSEKYPSLAPFHHWMQNTIQENIKVAS